MSFFIDIVEVCLLSKPSCSLSNMFLKPIMPYNDYQRLKHECFPIYLSRYL